MFRTVPLSIIRSISLYTQQWYMSYRFADSLRAGSGWNTLMLLASCQQTCMTYTIAVCTTKNSWWWTEELSKTCRVSFQSIFEIWEICASSWFLLKRFVTMHSHMNRGHTHTHTWLAIFTSDTNAHVVANALGNKASTLKFRHYIYACN